MSDQQYLYINSKRYSWNSAECYIAGTRIIGLKSLDYAEKRERKQVKGMNKSGLPLGKTSGSYSAEKAKGVFLVDTWVKIIIPRLSQLGAGSYGDAEFKIELQLNEPGQSPMLTELMGVHVVGASRPLSEGVDETLCEVEFDVTSVLENGLQLWSKAR